MSRRDRSRVPILAALVVMACTVSFDGTPATRGPDASLPEMVVGIQKLVGVQPLGAQTTIGACRNCAESQLQPDPNQPPVIHHHWVGSWPCNENPEGASCRVCTSTHCENPEVPHFGPCPDTECEAGGGGVHHLAAFERLEAGDLDWFAQQAENFPDRFGFDAERGAYQMYDCQGWVLLHVAVAEETALNQPDFPRGSQIAASFEGKSVDLGIDAHSPPQGRNSIWSPVGAR